ncbi:hypothetical protein ACED29_07050 [Shewanella sp. 5S214]|uniref:hypothetical protein n=1 Tax=Shewanella sp. 5S214 TaxID=3229999 RepID=UPI00352FEB4E
MKSREELVLALIEFRGSTPDLVKELRFYGWDSENELVTLTPQHIINVLNQYTSGEVSNAEVQDWANAIEQRDDIGLLETHKETLDEMVFWLANPVINYPITLELTERVIDNLHTNAVQ